MDIKVIKLVSGEEIITELQTVHNDQGAYIQMVNPCGIVMREQAGGRIKMEFLPLALAAQDQTVMLSSDAVVYTGEASEEATGTYKKRFSKIVTPDQKLVLASA